MVVFLWVTAVIEIYGPYAIYAAQESGLALWQNNALNIIQNRVRFFFSRKIKWV